MCVLGVHEVIVLRRAIGYRGDDTAGKEREGLCKGPRVNKEQNGSS